jgi:hypothetical protein
MLEAVLLVLTFFGLLALPLAPGLLERLRPRDDQPVEIDLLATGDPRDAGARFREALRGADSGVAALVAPGTAPASGALRTGPPVPEIHGKLRVPAGGEALLVLRVLGEAEVGERARLLDLYTQGGARLGSGVRVRALAADGDLVLGPECVVEDLIDTEATASVGPHCDLGRSASAARELHVGDGCTFRRLWGLPVAVDGPAAAAVSGPPVRVDVTIEDVVLWVGQRLSLPAGLVLERDLVVHGEVRVGAGAVIRGSLKAHGAIYLGEGVRVEANVIGRRGIHVEGGARIAGCVYAGGDVFIGPGAQVGGPKGFKTVYAGDRSPWRKRCWSSAGWWPSAAAPCDGCREAEPTPPPRLRPGGFHRAVARGRARHQGIDQAAGRPEHLVHRAVERGLVRLRRRVGPAELAHELERCRADLVVGVTIRLRPAGAEARFVVRVVDAVFRVTPGR